jgi:hypothetical protein
MQNEGSVRKPRIMEVPALKMELWGMLWSQYKDMPSNSDKRYQKLVDDKWEKLAKVTYTKTCCDFLRISICYPAHAETLNTQSHREIRPRSLAFVSVKARPSALEAAVYVSNAYLNVVRHSLYEPENDYCRSFMVVVVACRGRDGGGGGGWGAHH